MSWTETLELELDGIAQGGEGVGRWEGRVVFVAGGLPGERVRARITEQRDAYAHAVVEAVLSASPDRIAPRLPGADHIPWQHIAYPAQLQFKQRILREQLAKLGGQPDAQIAETVPAARPWGYRSSATLHVDQSGIGYHASGTQEVRPLDDDPLLQEPLNLALAALRQTLTPEDDLRDVSLRLSETYGYLVALLRGGGDLHPLATRWRGRDSRLAGVVPPTPPVEGVDHVFEEMEGLIFRFGPATFSQVNLAGAATLLQLVRAGLADQAGGRILDLFCGAGTFSLPLAKQASEVIGVEEFSPAIIDGEAAVELNAIKNVRFITGRVETALRDAPNTFDAVVLDPPRRGCHPRALDELLRLAPQRIVYVSCHPGTLARDIKILTGGGYQLLQSTPVDLFPQTPHIESVSVLLRNA